MATPRQNASRDQNHVPTLMGVSTADGRTPVPLEVDPLTGGLIVTSESTVSVAMAVQVDNYSTTNVIYVGKAPASSLTSSAVWQIQKIDKTTGVVITWANGNGNANFSNIFDNRLSLSYS